MFLLVSEGASAQQVHPECIENLDSSNIASLDATARRAALLGLVECLDNPDPAVRDRYAFTLLSEALRSGVVEKSTRMELIDAARAKLMEADQDPQGFRGPFEALALSELVRSDRIDPFLTSEKRGELIELVARYLAELSDYRGFDEHEGWRHGVAHSADFFMQMALNPALTTEQASLIRDAIKAKIVPGGNHFYTFGEPGRLARPIMILANRDMFPPEDWRQWIMELGPDGGADDWDAAYDSNKGLARIHNVTAFASAIVTGASRSEQPALRSLSDNASELLESLP
ncbi:MAG: DUF2785 domain-containing protein [Blastomonas sp.]